MMSVMVMFIEHGEASVVHTLVVVVVVALSLWLVAEKEPAIFFLVSQNNTGNKCSISLKVGRALLRRRKVYFGANSD